jgi:hypothetical protein
MESILTWKVFQQENLNGEWACYLLAMNHFLETLLQPQTFSTSDENTETHKFQLTLRDNENYDF